MGYSCDIKKYCKDKDEKIQCVTDINDYISLYPTGESVLKVLIYNLYSISLSIGKV